MVCTLTKGNKVRYVKPRVRLEKNDLPNHLKKINFGPRHRSLA